MALETQLVEYVIMPICHSLITGHRQSLIEKIIHNLARLIQEMGQQRLKSLSERPLESA